LALSSFLVGLSAWGASAETVTYDPPFLADANGGETCFFGERSAEPVAEPTPLVRYPPKRPKRCLRRANPSETVTLLFDIGPDGTTCNVRIAATTNECLNEAAAKAVLRWKYTATENGAADIETKMTMQLSSP
jgi:TonB family protein